MHEFLQDLATALVVFALGWLVTTTRSQARTAAKLASHEKTCADRYAQIIAQNNRAEEHQTGVSEQLLEMGKTLARVEENIRLRERQEDRR